MHSTLKEPYLGLVLCCFIIPKPSRWGGHLSPLPPFTPWRPRQGKWLAPEHAYSVNWGHLQATHPPWWSCCHVLLKSRFLQRILIFFRTTENKEKNSFNFTKSWVGKEAGQPAVGQHGLRGTWETMAESGISDLSIGSCNEFVGNGAVACHRFSVHLWPWLFN